MKTMPHLPFPYFLGNAVLKKIVVSKYYYKCLIRTAMQIYLNPGHPASQPRSPYGQPRP